MRNDELFTTCISVGAITFSGPTTFDVSTVQQVTYQVMVSSIQDSVCSCFEELNLLCIMCRRLVTILMQYLNIHLQVCAFVS